jgi:hypothetical protein
MNLHAQRRLLSRDELGYLFKIPTVFIPPGHKVQKVFERSHSQLFEAVCPLCTHSFNILYIHVPGHRIELLREEFATVGPPIILTAGYARSFFYSFIDLLNDVTGHAETSLTFIEGLAVKIFKKTL